MTTTAMPLDALLRHLGRLATRSLGLWDIPAGATARLINVSENATYLVEASAGFRAILRVHRGGYHTRRAIECELAWLAALDTEGVVATHRVRPGRDGAPVQSARIEGLAEPRHMVLFTFLEGTAPPEAGDLTGRFEELGTIAAAMHDHAARWRRPQPFERLVWDEEAVFGAAPTWGDWRRAPKVDAAIRPLLEAAERTVRARLAAWGKGPDRFGLIHADMRLANLLVDGTTTQLIDFDDCGLGWFLYDFAAAVSFIETSPQLPALRRAWVRGYRRIRPLPSEAEAEIDTFVMLRRMALLAWIGSHAEAPEPLALAPRFAQGTAELATAYLARRSAPG